MSQELQSTATAAWLDRLLTGCRTTPSQGATPCSGPDCKQDFSRHSLRQAPLKAAHESTSYKCDICGSDFNHSFALIEHDQLEHANGAPIECNSRTNIRSACGCGTRFPSRQALHRHQRSYITPSAVVAGQMSQQQSTESSSSQLQGVPSIGFELQQPQKSDPQRPKMAERTECAHGKAMAFDSSHNDNVPGLRLLWKSPVHNPLVREHFPVDRGGQKRIQST
jgi:hypothetical protein